MHEYGRKLSLNVKLPSIKRIESLGFYHDDEPFCWSIATSQGIS